MATMSGWRITRAGIIFIVITLLLAGLVIGGTYLVRERGEQARQQEAAEIARQNLEEDSEGPAVIAREEPEETETETGATGEAPVPGSTNEPVPGELPETGPASLAILVAAVLTFFAVSYVASHRALQCAGIRR